MAEKKNKKSRKNKNTGFAWALWGLVAILILIVFLVKKDTIVSNLKTTGFFDRVFGSTPQFVEKHEVVESETKTTKKNKNKSDEIVIDVVSEKSEEKLHMSDLKEDIITLKNNQATTENTDKPNKTEEDDKSDALKIKATVDENLGESRIEKSEAVKIETPKPAEVKTIDYNLCFLLFDSDGGVSRKIIKRTAQKNDSPLTDAINLLLKGPQVSNPSEKDCISLIPEGTRLLSARVENGIAYLNFSEEFEFNSYAAEGFRHQLEQIVFTATSFSTVKSVQFLIEGIKEEYLGSEGVWIGSPLARSSF